MDNRILRSAKLYSILLLSFCFIMTCDRLEEGELVWEELDFPFTQDLSAAYIQEDGSWHIVGGDLWVEGNYFLSLDQGLTWEQKTIHNKQLFSIKEDLHSNLYATGMSGFLFTKLNGEENWKSRNPVVWSTARDLAFVNPDKGILVGGEALINGFLVVYGEDYQKQDVQEWDRDISTVTFLNEDTWLIAGFGFIAKSTDGGFNWTINEFSGDFFVDMIFLNEDTGYVIGNSGTIAKTVDGGDSWISQRNAYDLFISDLALNAVFFKNPMEGYICGDDGFFIFTKDGGENWEQVLDLPAEDFLDLVYANDFGLLLGENGLVIKFD